MQSFFLLPLSYYLSFTLRNPWLTSTLHVKHLVRFVVQIRKCQDLNQYMRMKLHDYELALFTSQKNDPTGESDPRPKN